MKVLLRIRLLTFIVMCISGSLFIIELIINGFTNSSFENLNRFILSISLIISGIVNIVIDRKSKEKH